MNLLSENNLGNGVTFTITEHSRPIAADRWYVKVVGMITLTPAEAVWTGISEDNPALLARVRRHLGETLEQPLVKDRNFVDAVAKDEAVRELVNQLKETVGAYLEVEAFPARFLAKKYREAREICRLAMLREAITSSATEEPVDFSHCFK